MPSAQARGLLLAVLFASCVPGADDRAADLDRDGLPDRLEQELLEKFAPRFLISAAECDVLPARFRPDAPDPALLEKDGTIYGRSAPWGPGGGVELQYFHLWWRDCGRRGHPLDVEHVSVLLGRLESGWAAEAWYASAHQGTVCDAGNAAPAAALGARDRGATVWISRGKHASFLSEDLCKGGCGGDKCGPMIPLAPPRIVNLGELDAPLNGSLWVRSPKWPFAEKLATDFTPDVMALLAEDKAGKVAPRSGSRRAAQALVLAGSSTAGAIETGQKHTGEALDTAGVSTDNALATGKKSVSRSLGRAARATGRFLGIRREEKK